MRPIQYKTTDATDGPRIGGKVPTGLESEIVDDKTQYFGTFPISSTDAQKKFSVFHRFEIFGEDPERDVIDYNNRILRPSRLIWAVVHDASSRGTANARAFEARSLHIGPETLDEAVDDDGTVLPYTESKLGGRCFLERYWLQESVEQIEADGFQFLMQIGAHDEHLIDGFPWDPGFLHVWARDPLAPDSYRFMIEQ